MGDISATETQRERFETIRTELAAAFAGEYASVTDEDVLAYLLDGYTPPEPGDAGEAADDGAPDAPDEADADADGAGPSADGGSDGFSEAEIGGSTDDGGSRVDSMMSLLDDHEDKWRESSSGDTPYEVDLPDGSTEGARTKDDVRAILFTNY